MMRHSLNSTSFGELVSDDSPSLHVRRILPLSRSSGNDGIPVLRSCAESGINLFPMERLLLFFIISAAFPFGLFASDSLPFLVSIGGQAAKDGTPFAKIEHPVAADATRGRIEERHDHCEREYGDCEKRTGPRLNARGDFAPGQNQNDHRQNDGRKEASCRKLHHERGERRQHGQYPLYNQVAFIRAKRFVFRNPTSWRYEHRRTPLRCFFAETAFAGFDVARPTAATVSDSATSI